MRLKKVLVKVILILEAWKIVMMNWKMMDILIRLNLRLVRMVSSQLGIS
jgi:hypothetical protein